VKKSQEERVSPPGDAYRLPMNLLRLRGSRASEKKSNHQDDKNNLHLNPTTIGLKPTNRTAESPPGKMNVAPDVVGCMTAPDGEQTGGEEASRRLC
jgi:hypothetical protein